VPITVTHPSFIPSWKELHDHIFNAPVHPLCLELMPDFQPTSKVICSSPYFQPCPSLLIMILSFSAGYSTCPTCQDNLL
jgi:hypothetical protein